MLKKIFSKIGLVCMLILFLAIGTFFISDIGAQVYEKFFRGNVLIGGKLHVVGCGRETMRISHVSGVLVGIGIPGNTLTCVGLTAGVGETGAVEGFTIVDDAADFLRIEVQLPDDWVDNGVATNMEFEFDILEIGAAQCDIDVRFFEYGNTTPILTDTIAITNGTARGWVNLVTNSTGIGADADLDAGDTLVIEITANTNADDFRIYGIRMKYAVGLEMAVTEANR